MFSGPVRPNASSLEAVSVSTFSPTLAVRTLNTHSHTRTHTLCLIYGSLPIQFTGHHPAQTLHCWIPAWRLRSPFFFCYSLNQLKWLIGCTVHVCDCMCVCVCVLSFPQFHSKPHIPITRADESVLAEIMPIRPGRYSSKLAPPNRVWAIDQWRAGKRGLRSVSFAQSEGAGWELAALQPLVLTSEVQLLFKTSEQEYKGIFFGFGGFSIFLFLYTVTQSLGCLFKVSATQISVNGAEISNRSNSNFKLHAESWARTAPDKFPPFSSIWAWFHNENHYSDLLRESRSSDVRAIGGHFCSLLKEPAWKMPRKETIYSD